MPHTHSTFLFLFTFVLSTSVEFPNSTAFLIKFGVTKNNAVVRFVSSVWRQGQGNQTSFFSLHLLNGRNRNNHNQKTLTSTTMAVQDKSHVHYIKDKLNAIKFNDKLFTCIEKNQIKYQTTNNDNGGDDNDQKGFGRFLDAGTGSHSLRWIASLIQNDEEGLQVSHYTAITADEKMRQTVLKEAKSLNIFDNGDIIIGNWQSDDLLKGIDGEYELFDTILADYLVGAMDGFSPYYQDTIFERLARHLKPGGKLYIVGLNPIPDKVNGDANIFCRITKLRDACILLAGHRCYREYPPHWIERHLERANLKLLDKSEFDILYSHQAMVRQLNVARSKLPLFPNEGLANEMGKTMDALEKESGELIQKAPNERLRLGFDYVITAEKNNSH